MVQNFVSLEFESINRYLKEKSNLKHIFHLICCNSLNIIPSCVTRQEGTHPDTESDWAKGCPMLRMRLWSFYYKLRIVALTGYRPRILYEIQHMCICQYEFDAALTQWIPTITTMYLYVTLSSALSGHLTCLTVNTLKQDTD